MPGPNRTGDPSNDERTCTECGAAIDYIRLVEGEFRNHPCGCIAPDPRKLD